MGEPTRLKLEYRKDLLELTNTKEVISPAEWRVMRVVWTLGRADAKTVGASLGETPHWAPATVKTLLNRLVKKGFLATEQVGRRFIYSATVEEQAMMTNELTSLMDAMCAHKVGGAITDALSNLTLSQADLKELAALINKKQETAPTHVACDCVRSGEDGAHHCE